MSTRQPLPPVGPITVEWDCIPKKRWVLCCHLRYDAGDGSYQTASIISPACTLVQPVSLAGSGRRADSGLSCQLAAFRIMPLGRVSGGPYPESVVEKSPTGGTRSSDCWRSRLSGRSAFAVDQQFQSRVCRSETFLSEISVRASRQYAGNQDVYEPSTAG